MRTVVLIFLGLIIGWSLAGQDTGRTSDFQVPAGVPWKAASDYPEPLFRFATIGDLTGGYRREAFPQIVERIGWLRPDFVMSVGDLIEGYTYDEEQIGRWWEQFDSWVQDFPAPFFYVPGNHDLSNDLMTRLWEERHGSTYYSFRHRGVTFLVLNTEDGAPSHISEEQVTFVQDVLATIPEQEQILLFFHKPLWQSNEPGFLAIENMLAGRPYTVFAGHQHRYSYRVRKGRPYFVLATCGGGNALRGAEFGELDHLAWVTVYPDTLVVTNLETEGIYPDTLLTQNKRARVGAFSATAEGLLHEPIFPEASARDTKTLLTLPNRTSRPIKVHLYARQHDAVRVYPGSIDTVLAAGSILSLPIKLSRLPGQEWPSASQPVQWKVEVQELNGDNPLLRTYSYFMPCLYALSCLRSAQLPTLDGKLDEWDMPEWVSPGELGYYPDTWTGPDDLQMAAQVQASADTLYLALKVRDDHFYFDSYRNSWEQDAAELILNLGEERAAVLGFIIRENQELLVDKEQHLPKGYRLSACRMDGGMTAEIAIPFPKEFGGSFQLQWVVYDHDQREDPYKGTKAWLFPNYQRYQTYHLQDAEK
jgi:hypothetical protein